MFKTLSLYLYTQPRDELWLVFLPTRRLVERYSSNYGGVYIHGGLEGLGDQQDPGEGGDGARRTSRSLLRTSSRPP